MCTWSMKWTIKHAAIFECHCSNFNHKTVCSHVKHWCTLFWLFNIFKFSRLKITLLQYFETGKNHNWQQVYVKKKLALYGLACMTNYNINIVISQKRVWGINQSKIWNPATSCTQFTVAIVTILLPWTHFLSL